MKSRTVHFLGVKLIKYTSSLDSFVDGSRTETILDLGHHGFADSFFAEKMLTGLETLYH